MCSAAPSIGKGPSIQGPLSGHSGHGRTRCWPAPVVIDPISDIGLDRHASFPTLRLMCDPTLDVKPCKYGYAQRAC